MRPNVLVLNLSIFVSSLALGCLAQSDPPQDEDTTAGDSRGPLGKADQGGASCEGYCGGKSPGYCWCDDLCEYFGDCCADKQLVCDGAGETSGGGEDSGSGSTGGDPPPPSAVTQLACGGEHTCALLDTGAVRCWGDNGFGQLGYGHTEAIGDDETPADAGDVDLGGVAIQIATARRHTCALLDTGAVRCWGQAYVGKLGYGDNESIGDDEPPAAAGDVDVGAPVVQVQTAGQHTCAVTTAGALRCWGDGNYDGIPGSVLYGLQEPPSAAPDVDMGGEVEVLTAGDRHTCVRLTTGGVRCFGTGLQGQHGQGTTLTIGDNEHPSTFGDVPLRYYQQIEELAAGLNHTCVRYDSDTLRCWGINWDRQCGYTSPELIRNPEHVSAVNLGSHALSIAAGNYHTCAILESGAIKCWGSNVHGQLGAGHTNSSTSDPSFEAEVALAGAPVQASAGAYHTCALLDGGAVQCWGRGVSGQLGYGNTDNIGDDEPADVGGLVQVF